MHDRCHGVKFSAHFGITRSRADDWFDPDLSIETKLFVDPFLLLDEASTRARLGRQAARIFSTRPRGSRLAAPKPDAAVARTQRSTAQPRPLSFPE